jgi:hypothetical protein
MTVVPPEALFCASSKKDSTMILATGRAPADQ